MDGRPEAAFGNSKIWQHDAHIDSPDCCRLRQTKKLAAELQDGGKVDDALGFVCLSSAHPLTVCKRRALNQAGPGRLGFSDRIVRVRARPLSAASPGPR